jgi:hypothetical protein
MRYLLMPVAELLNQDLVTNPQYHYASICEKSYWMGDLGFGDDSAIDIVSKGRNSFAIVLKKAVHPKKLDSFTKMFCGGPKPQPAGSHDFVSGRGYGMTFQLPGEHLHPVE